eukprot:6859650-Prymnesium_polylepis.1
MLIQHVGPQARTTLVDMHRAASSLFRFLTRCASRSQVKTTLADVRSSASSLFPHSSGPGYWRVFVGANLQALRFVPDE